MQQARKSPSRFHSDNPADAAWRAEQAHVDADIVGLPRDPDAERLVAEMTAEGVPIERQIERIKAYYVALKAEEPAVA